MNKQIGIRATARINQYPYQFEYILGYVIGDTFHVYDNDHTEIKSDQSIKLPMKSLTMAMEVGADRITYHSDAENGLVDRLHILIEDCFKYGDYLGPADARIVHVALERWSMDLPAVDNSTQLTLF